MSVSGLQVLDRFPVPLSKGDEEHALECLLSAMAAHRITQQSSYLFQEELLIHEIQSSLVDTTIVSKECLLDKELVAALQHVTQHILPSLTPFQLHATVQQAIVWGETTDSSSENKDGGTTTIFTLICLILCCRALQQCPETIVNRRERWRSLLWETLHLFQFHSGSQSSHLQGGRSPFLFLCLWINCFVPALTRVHDALENGIETSFSDWRERRFRVAWVAAIIATTSHLLHQVTTMHTYQNQDTDPTIAKISEKLLNLVREHVVVKTATSQESLLCFHPWRKNISPRKIFVCTEPSFEALLAAYTVPKDNEDDDDVDDAAERNVITKVSEEMCFVDSEWNRTGIALLVASYWYNKPLVWSREYQWRLFFPHVSSLLLVHDDGQVDQDNKDKSKQIAYKEHVQQVGFGLLISLIRNITRASLEMSNTAFDKPVSPLGLFQLLSNQVVASSLSKGADLLPSAGQTYQVMKDLLSVYTPHTQYQLVRNLVQTCPHPGMKPKLLDLWRGFILWQDQAAVQSVLSHLQNQYIERLARDYVDHSHSKQMIANAVELISSAELHVAALGLIQICLKMNHLEKPATLYSSLSSLVQIKSSLEAAFEYWTLETAGQRHEPPTDSFRLYLLHDAVCLAIDLLSENN
jgi:hypothetical protein